MLVYRFSSISRCHDAAIIGLVLPYAAFPTFTPLGGSAMIVPPLLHARPFVRTQLLHTTAHGH